MNDEMEKYGRKRSQINRGTISVFACRDRAKPQKSSLGYHLRHRFELSTSRIVVLSPDQNALLSGILIDYSKGLLRTVRQDKGLQFLPRRIISKSPVCTEGVTEFILLNSGENTLPVC